jgi:hypothetical protein
MELQIPSFLPVKTIPSKTRCAEQIGCRRLAVLAAVVREPDECAKNDQVPVGVEMPLAEKERRLLIHRSEGKIDSHNKRDGEQYVNNWLNTTGPAHFFHKPLFHFRLRHEALTF